ncbi:hypothetical protein ARMGADRAFT_1070780 [Armillaria gallica]|uniref:Uncharacterized protein n=1 Tax=Armillaria gallica TaxID=47427 RepID=A0A2H3EA81_ARMGA|nr:hypothetical protein ARMGADRAFT_1070780 [Armillaria gallica]
MSLLVWGRWPMFFRRGDAVGIAEIEVGSENQASASLDRWFLGLSMSAFDALTSGWARRGDDYYESQTRSNGYTFLEEPTNLRNILLVGASKG